MNKKKLQKYMKKRNIKKKDRKNISYFIKDFSTKKQKKFIKFMIDNREIQTTDNSYYDSYRSCGLGSN